MYNNCAVTAVVLAAGNSSRMGLNVNKVYLMARKKPIIEYSVKAFLTHPFVDDVIIVVRDEDKAIINDFMEKRFGENKKISFATGGALRSDSVYNAISATDSEYVIIHDGARPMIKQSYITDCVKAMNNYCGAIVALKSEETLCITDACRNICDITRELYRAQTPQCFHTEVLKKCHNLAKGKVLATDDSYLLEIEGYPVKVIDGDIMNIKITTRGDYDSFLKGMRAGC